MIFIVFSVNILLNQSTRADYFLEDETISVIPLKYSLYIDATDDKDRKLNFIREKELKSIKEFEDFLKDTRNTYFTLWIMRIAQVNLFDISGKENQMLINPVSWFKNFFGFQNKGDKRGSFSWNDGDSTTTNWVWHPAFGASLYLYYRSKGYDMWSSAFGSVLQSTLFEYTIEGVTQSPSIHDLVITPGVGVPVGILLEETSKLLEESDSNFLNGMSYIVNPFKLLVSDNDNLHIGPFLGQQVVVGFNW